MTIHGMMCRMKSWKFEEQKKNGMLVVQSGLRGRATWIQGLSVSHLTFFWMLGRKSIDNIVHHWRDTMTLWFRKYGFPGVSFVLHEWHRCFQCFSFQPKSMQ